MDTLRKVLIIVASAVELLSGCNWVKPTINPSTTVVTTITLTPFPIFVGTITPVPSPTIDGTITFENPSFPCPTNDVREPEQGYPYPIRQDTGEKKSVSELVEFCSIMKQRFSQPGMSVTEAAEIYSLLKADNNDIIPWLHNECYGMPKCIQEPYILDKQVMIKKIDNEEYELFFSYIGCGINYDYMKIFIEQNKIDRYKFFERWSESFPC